MGLSFDRLKQYNTAIKYYDKAISLNPERYKEMYHEAMKEADTEYYCEQARQEYLTQ